MSKPRNRSRTVTDGPHYVGYYKNNTVYTYYNVSAWSQTEVCSDWLHRGPPYRSGGPLFISKYNRDVKLSQHASLDAGSGKYHVEANFAVGANVNLCGPYTESSISGWGAKGWAMYQPAKPVYEFGVAIAELRDVPGMLKQTAALLKKMRNLGLAMHTSKSVTLGTLAHDLRSSGRGGLGSDYLNLQFGWAPLLGDVLAALSIKDKLQKKLAYLKRNNKKSIRRRGKVHSDQWTELKTAYSTQGPGAYPLYPNITGPVLNSAKDQRRVTLEYMREIWFSAKFRYYIPELDQPDDSWGMFGLKASLLGLTLNPASLYKAIPWTWLIDWFSNVGDVVSNITNNARYHVVAEYAYIMAHEKVKTINVAQGTYENKRPWNSASVPSIPVQYQAEIAWEKDWKRREAANPYGFGLTLGDLNSYQISILVALGLTRL